MNYMTAQQYASKFCGNPVDGIIMLDLEEINRGDRKCGKKWKEFKAEAIAKLEQIIKDAAIYATMA